MIYYLPIEPLEERYTEQWYRWFPEEFERRGLNYEVIDGETLVDEVQVGTVLDINSTLYYKASQLREVASLFHHRAISDGDVFFIADVEFWGIESIRYLADLQGIDIKIFGFCHAGSYTIEDFMEPCAPYAQDYERAWGKVFDLIFVGSEYHKKALIDRRGLPHDRIRVTGNPFDVGEARSLVPSMRKRPRVIMTNRPDPEKRPGDTLACFVEMKRKHPSWEFVVTTSRRRWGSGELRDRALAMQDRGEISILEGLSKQAYYQALANSQVMTGNTIEENFGYCVLEALVFDTIPVVPNAFSHPELVGRDPRCLFGTPQGQAYRIKRGVLDPFPVMGYAERYSRSLGLIADHIQEGMNP